MEQALRDRLMQFHQEVLEQALMDYNKRPLSLTEEEAKDLSEFLSTFLYD